MCDAKQVGVVYRCVDSSRLNVFFSLSLTDERKQRGREPDKDEHVGQKHQLS